MAFSKKTWYNKPSTSTPINATGLNDLENRINTAFGNIVSAQFGGNGYMRFDNGFQIAWTGKTESIGGTEWNSTTKLWYSDHTMGNWAASFEAIYMAIANVKSNQFWASIENYTGTSAGTLRVFRPNNTKGTAWISALAIGRWK